MKIGVFDIVVFLENLNTFLVQCKVASFFKLGKKLQLELCLLRAKKPIQASW